jgi:hypothetical protein
MEDKLYEHNQSVSKRWFSYFLLNIWIIWGGVTWKILFFAVKRTYEQYQPSCMTCLLMLCRVTTRSIQSDRPTLCSCSAPGIGFKLQLSPPCQNRVTNLEGHDKRTKKSANIFKKSINNRQMRYQHIGSMLWYIWSFAFLRDKDEYLTSERGRRGTNQVRPAWLSHAWLFACQWDCILKLK